MDKVKTEKSMISSCNATHGAPSSKGQTAVVRDIQESHWMIKPRMTRALVGLVMSIVLQVHN